MESLSNRWVLRSLSNRRDSKGSPHRPTRPPPALVSSTRIAFENSTTERFAFYPSPQHAGRQKSVSLMARKSFFLAEFENKSVGRVLGVAFDHKIAFESL